MLRRSAASLGLDAGLADDAFHLADSAAWNLASSADVVVNGSVPVDW
jgi:hypothetical protein